MNSKPLKTSEIQGLLPATDIHPGDFPLGCVQSRAAARLLFSQNEIWANCGKREASFTAGPLHWLTACTKTEDSHWMAKGTEPVAHFPKCGYFLPIVEYLFKQDRVFILKSREMMTSWLICGFVAWMAQWFPHTFWIMQSQKEDKAAELINYCRILYRNQPEWMSKRNPITVDNEMELKLEKGGRILGLPGGADQVRMHHPYGYVMDEAAFMPDAEASYNAVLPVTKQIIGVSTDNIGWYHNECKF